MKELKEIIDGIAHSLNIAASKLVDVYPQLRTEYSWYYLLENLQDTLGTLVLINGFLACGSLIFMVFTYNEYEDDYTRALKVFKLSLGVEILFVLLYVVAFTLQGFMCPDILIINKFIN